MSNNANLAAVAHLISREKAINTGTTAHLAVVEALGEAGGVAAVAHLISREKAINTGTTAHLAVVKALGRAGRFTE
ncbi:hypothetical protein [Acinetobacter rudis]|uniref:Uncharacterized protein n=1 Tax=Acinetobacter rudis TaxID=632955 RepID=A0AAW8J9G2_9GAMM|nr:hypothetical protein [Acinetobacter rudis]MDQ8935804.1 hypothetical protein [Acinetobacter rudis]MDQ9017995.1 hypothetical protein [Acinetobacter rudis]